MKNVRVLAAVGALVAAALVGGTLIGSALASDHAGAGGTTTGDSATAARAEYCEVFLDRFAQELHVERSALLPAARTAAIAAVDAAVAAGDLSSEDGDRIKERIESVESLPCAGLGHRFAKGGRDHGPFGRIPAMGLLHKLSDAAAEALGLGRREVTERMLGGESLRDIASAQNVDYENVRAAVLEAARERVASAVERGRLDQEAADRVVERLDEWLAAGGDLPFQLEVDGEGFVERFRIQGGGGDRAPAFGR